jgi:hypothetical protein
MNMVIFLQVPSNGGNFFYQSQLLRNWREQRPGNKSDLDLNVTVEVGRVYYTGVDLLLITFLYRST